MVKAMILGGCDQSENKQFTNKALYKIRDKTMIEYVIDALIQSQCIDEMVIVGDKKEFSFLTEIKNVCILQSTTSLTGNVLKGIDQFKKHKVLIATSDIPMLTKEAVQDFVINALQTEADFCYAIIPKEKMIEKYPSIQKTYVKLKEGTFTGGNLFLVDSSKIQNMMQLGEQMLSYRKKPWKMCHLLGMKFLMKLFIGKLSVEEIERKVNYMMGIQTKAVVSSYPEIGSDIDKEEDLIHTKRYIIEYN